MPTGRVEWDAVPQTDKYTVYRSQAQGTQGSKIGESTTLLYDDATVVEGQSYFYGVTASNAGGEGPLSAQAKLDVTAAPGVPPAPTNLRVSLVN